MGASGATVYTDLSGRPWGWVVPMVQPSGCCSQTLPPARPDGGGVGGSPGPVPTLLLWVCFQD